MMTRRYVKMRERPQGRPGRTAPVEPLYETERKAMTVETLREHGIMTEEYLRQASDDRPGTRVVAQRHR